MLIAGDENGPEASLAKECLAALSCKKKMETIADAAKLGEEARLTERISRVACLWFEQYLV